MTPEGELCVKISEEFLKAYPDMKEHFMLLQTEPDGEPKVAIDEMAVLALQRWIWHEGYHYRERIRALLSMVEEHTGGTICDRSPLPRRRRAS